MKKGPIRAEPSRIAFMEVHRDSINLAQVSLKLLLIHCLLKYFGGWIDTKDASTCVGFSLLFIVKTELLIYLTLCSQVDDPKRTENGDFLLTYFSVTEV